MTKLFEKAIAHARALPPDDQDTLSALLLAMTNEGTGPVPLDYEARAAIHQGLEQARRGEDADIGALWKRFDLRGYATLRELATISAPSPPVSSSTACRAPEILPKPCTR